MSARDDLLNAMQDYIQSGHTFQVSPSEVQVPGVLHVKVSISGPTGSRTAFGIDLHHAMSDLFAQIVAARLSR